MNSPGGSMSSCHLNAQQSAINTCNLIDSPGGPSRRWTIDRCEESDEAAGVASRQARHHAALRGVGIIVVPVVNYLCHILPNAIYIYTSRTMGSLEIRETCRDLY